MRGLCRRWHTAIKSSFQVERIIYIGLNNKKDANLIEHKYQIKNNKYKRIIRALWFFKQKHFRAGKKENTNNQYKLLLTQTLKIHLSLLPLWSNIPKSVRWGLALVIVMCTKILNSPRRSISNAFENYYF